jgi:hypothetical protein
MGIAKRPKLATGYSGPRAGERDVVSLEALCRVAEGAETTVSVLDLDARGCRVHGITAAVTKGARVSLRMGTAAPIEARLRWAKGGSAGLAFVAPLTDQALGAIQESAARSTRGRVVPLRRSLSGGET